MKKMIQSKHTANRIKTIFNDFKESQDKLLIFCAGTLTELLLENYSCLEQLNIVGIIDSDKEKHGKKIGKYIIYPPSEIKHLNPSTVIVSTLNTKSIILKLNSIKSEDDIFFKIIADLYEFDNSYDFEESDFSNSELIKVEVGAGNTPRKGYIHCDVQKLPHIEHVCNAWEIPFESNFIDGIYSRHMLEHLTFNEGRQTLESWFDKLKEGGRLEVVLPDFNFHIRQFLGEDFSWTDDKNKNLEHAMAGFYGWQTTPYDLHKWGYTKKSIVELLKDIGFIRLNFIPDEKWNIHLECYKPNQQNHLDWNKWLKDNMDERMDPNSPFSPKNNALYHKYRYEFAESNYVKDKVVLDIACGVGYGSYILSQSAIKVIGVDIANDALEYAKQFYAKDNIEYLKGSTDCIPLDDNSVEVVVSFETIEHILDDNKFLDEVYRVLRIDGFFIISTPNGFSDNGYHYRGYDCSQFKKLLSEKYKIESFYNYQNVDNDNYSPTLIPTTEENHLQAETFYVVCKK